MKVVLFDKDVLSVHCEVAHRWSIIFCSIIGSSFNVVGLHIIFCHQMKFEIYCATSKTSNSCRQHCTIFLQLQSVCQAINMTEKKSASCKERREVVYNRVLGLQKCLQARVM
jgi:hypothetical protein